jgi:hypothetical protein
MRREAIPLAIIFILVLAATVTGIFYHPGGRQIQAVTVRGQPALYQGSGLYKYNPVSFAREGVVWDVIDLCIALPLFAVSSVASMKNSLRGRLFLGGLLAYFFYVYLSCAMMYAFNDLFLVYIAIFALSIVAFGMNAVKISVKDLPSRMRHRFPRRLYIWFSILLACALAVLWISRIISVMQTGLLPAEYAGLNTLGSQALDLGLIVPMAAATAMLLARRSAWGYYLCSLAITFGLMMFITIPAWVTVPLIQDGKTSVFEAVPFFALSLIGIALAIVFYANVRETQESPP